MPKKLRYVLNLLGFTLVLLALAASGFVVYLTRLYLHPPQQTPSRTPAQYGIPFEDIELLTKDGLKLKAWYTAPQNGALILVAHGHAAYRLADYYSIFAKNGYGVLAWDARAHGESEGDLSTLGYSELLDAEAALDFALQQLAVRRIGAHGISMGGATLIRAAARRLEIQALVADSAYASMAETIAFVDLPTPLQWVMRLTAEWETGVSVEQLRPIDEVQHISPRPVFLIQGLADGRVKPDSAQRLYAAAGEPRQLWTEPGVGHVAMYLAFGVEYERRVIEFFDEALLGE